MAQTDDVQLREQLTRERAGLQEDDGSWAHDPMLTARTIRELCELGGTGSEPVERGAAWLLERPESEANPGMFFVTDRLVDRQAEILAKLESAGFQVEKHTVWGYPITRASHFWIRRQQDKMMSASPPAEQSKKRTILLRLKPLLRLARYLFWIDNLFNFTEKGVGIVVKARRLT